jgi:hypothetical protein
MDADIPNYIIGFVGGFAAEGLGIWKITRTHTKMPAIIKRPLYWIMSLFMCLMGMLLVFLYTTSGVTMIPILAFNIGVSAPFILGNLTKHDMSKKIL